MAPTIRLSLRRAVPLAAIACGAVAGLALFWDMAGFETLRDHRAELIAWRDRNYVAALIGFMSVYVAVVTFSLPGGAVMTMAGGFLFGVPVGAAASVLSATLGATLLFLATRAGLGAALHARMMQRGGAGTIGRIGRGLRENRVSYLLLMRLVPVIPFFVANLAPAFLGVPLRLYVLTTFFGIMPGTTVYTWFGAGLGEVFARGEAPEAGILLEPAILVPLLGLAALAALPIPVRAWRRRRRGGD